MRKHMSELEDFMSETTQPVAVHAMAATAPVCGEGEKGEAAAMLENIDFCRNFCPWLDEQWTAASDASTALAEPSAVYVEKTTGSNMETISFCSDFCSWLDEDWTVASDAGRVQDEMPDEISPPENTVEKDTTGGRRRSRIYAFFKRVWKAIKKPFLCCRRTRVEPQTPQENPHTTHPDQETDSYPEPVPELSGLQNTVRPNSDSEPVPGPSKRQISVDPVLDPKPVPGPSWCQHTVYPNPDPEPVPGLSGLQNTVDLVPDPEPVPGPSRCQHTVDPNPDPEPVPRPSGFQNTVDPVPDPEPVPGPSRGQHNVDLNPDPEPVPGPSRGQHNVDLNPDPEPVPGPSRCQNTVDLNPDQEPVPGPSGREVTVDPVPDPVPGPSRCQNTVDLNPDPEPVPGMSGLQNTVDPVPDPEPVPGQSRGQNTVDPNPDPEPVPGPSRCQNTVDLNPDPEPVPGPSGRQVTVDPVPDPEPVPGPSRCQNTVDLNPDPEPVPGPSGRQVTFDPVPYPEDVSRASGGQNTVDPDPEPVPGLSARQLTFDPVPDPEPLPGPFGLQAMADGESSSATGPNRELLNSLYSFGDILGAGSFGITYKAIRKSDGKEVAIKRIRKRLGDRYLSVPGYSKPVFKEAAFMLMLKNPPTSIYLIEMYEWFDQEGFISLVMEYPKPCISLGTFVRRRGMLKEPITRCLMHQLIQAIKHSLQHGIFHNDVHPDNILVNTKTFELKLIDFGCAKIYKEEDHEMIISGSIWILGYLLYLMVNGKVPLYAREKKGYRLRFMPNISSGCCDLIEKCLKEDLSTLEEVLEHEWMKKL
ncbi:uncharacterized protein [Danio rerio]|uniref:Uncharacterized protein n=1 Tax=Danio rerio TaxID=7955 RepID=A0AC58GSQ1_DANRE